MFWMCNCFNKTHEDPRTDIRNKFHYLLQSTKENTVPRQIIESFPAKKLITRKWWIISKLTFTMKVS